MGTARTKVDDCVPEVLDDDVARELCKRGEQACPFCVRIGVRELLDCTLARAVASLETDELEEEREWRFIEPSNLFGGTIVCVDVVEREDEEEEDGAGE